MYTEFYKKTISFWINEFICADISERRLGKYFLSYCWHPENKAAVLFFRKAARALPNYIRRGKIKISTERGNKWPLSGKLQLRPLGRTQRHHFPWERSRNKPLTTPGQSTEPTETTKTTEKENTETPRPKETKQLAIRNNRSRCQLKLPNIMFAEYRDLTWLHRVIFGKFVYSAPFK